MTVTTTTEVGRAKLEHPDFDYEGGVPLHTLITDIYTLIGNNLPIRYYEIGTLTDTSSVQLVHDFNLSLTQLDWHVQEDGAGRSKIWETANITVTEVDANTIEVTNVSGADITDLALQIYSFKWQETIANHVAANKIGGYNRYVGSGFGMYAKLQDAISASNANDSILVTETHVLDAGLTIDKTLNIDFLAGSFITLPTDSQVLISANNCRIKGLEIRKTATFTITDFFTISGHRNHLSNAGIIFTDTPTITNLFNLTGNQNYLESYIYKAAVPTITNVVTQTGTENFWNIRGA